MASAEELFKRNGLKMNLKPKYTLYTYDKIINEVETISKDAAEIIEFSSENCKILLHHFKWDFNKLTEKFFDASSAKDFIKKSKIKYLHDDAVKEDTVALDKCRICKEIKDVALLSCEHLFCFDCWKSIARSEKEKLEEKNVLPYITCDFEGCEAPIPEAFTLQLFCDPETYHFYQHTVIQSFIQSNPLFKWCPNQSNGCTLAVKIDTSEVEAITCECGFTYCFNCNDIPHSPFPCILIQKWKEELEVRENRDHRYSSFNCPHCYESLCTFIIFGTITCLNCNEICKLNDLQSQGSINDEYVTAYNDQNALLKKEFQELVLLEKIDDQSVDFLKTALKFLHTFRQKSLNFYAFCFFLENSQIFAKFQTELRSLLDKTTNLLNSPFIKDAPSSNTNKPYFSIEKQFEIIDVLVATQNQLKAQLKSFYEDDWKFKEAEIEKAMIECKY